MNKIISCTLISVLLISKISFAQFSKSDSTITFSDSINSEYIIYADSATGFLKKCYNMRVVRKINIKKTLPYYLSEQIGEPDFFNLNGVRIDWILYKVGGRVYSILDYGNLSNMFFKKEAFHKAP